MTSRLILGTAQFGLNYGINNKRGKIPKKEVFEILTYAVKNKINFLDTAYDYQESEKVIGDFVQENRPNFKIISKLPASGVDNISNFLNKSIKNLGVKSLYGYLFHDFGSFINRLEALKVLQSYRKKGLIKKIGFSLYYPNELKYLLRNNIDFDIVQFPYSLFDQRFENYFPLLRKRKVEIYVRSVFLQGLVFQNPSQLKGRFLKLKSKLSFLRNLIRKNNIPFSALAIDFILLNQYIDKIIIGVDNLKDLKENIKALKYKNKVKKLFNSLKNLKENDEDIILPLKWK